MLTRLFLSNVASADALSRAISLFWFRMGFNSPRSNEARISCSNSLSWFMSLISRQEVSRRLAARHNALQKNLALAFNVRNKVRIVLYPHYQHFLDRKSTRLNSSHQIISYAVFCLKKK